MATGKDLNFKESHQVHVALRSTRLLRKFEIITLSLLTVGSRVV